MKTLNITSSRPALDITSTKAQLSAPIKIRRFTARRVPPEMKVERQAATFKVNWRKVWAQTGRKMPDDLRQQVVQNGKQQTSKYINKVVTNGDYMSQQLKNYIGTDINPIGELAWNDMMSDRPEINVARVPETTPDIEWDPGYIRIEWSTGEVQIDWDDDFMPEITVSPHSVEIRLTGHKEIKISVDESKIRHADGKKVNKSV